ARTRGWNGHRKYHHSLRISHDATRIARGSERDYRWMVRTSRFGAQRNQLLVKITLLRIRIASERNGQQEIRIRRDAHMIAVLRQQLITQGVHAGRNCLAAKIGHTVGQVDHANELCIRQLRIERAGNILRRSLKLSCKPELRRPTAVERYTVSLVFDRLLQRGGSSRRRQ